MQNISFLPVSGYSLILKWRSALPIENRIGAELVDAQMGRHCTRKMGAKKRLERLSSYTCGRGHTTGPLHCLH